MLHRMFFAQNVLSVALGYGRLYNGYAASDARLAPAGWHVPTLSDLNSVIATIGSDRGDLLKEAGTSHWEYPNSASNGSGFTLLGAGYRISEGFTQLKTYGTFCSSEYMYGSNYFVYAQNNSNASQTAYFGDDIGGRAIGQSVRLVKDDFVSVDSVTDYDGNVYNTVAIGTHIWTKENWKCTKYNDGTSIPNVTDNTTWAALTTGAMCAYNNDENNV